jgi:hypothetical protein
MASMIIKHTYSSNIANIKYPTNPATIMIDAARHTGSCAIRSKSDIPYLAIKAMVAGKASSYLGTVKLDGVDVCTPAVKVDIVYCGMDCQ